MRRRPPRVIHLTRAERKELQRLLRDGRTEPRVARRSQILLAMEHPRILVDDLAQRVAMTPTGVWYVCRRYESAGLDAIYDAPRTGRPREISELERVAIEQLAGCDLQGLKLELTHWSTRSRTAFARTRLQRPQLAHSTVSLILRDAKLQLPRSRSWITPTLDDEFVWRATRIVWLDERVKGLLAHDDIVIAVDEKPNLQALERARPKQRMRSGQIERQEFEYERHETVNFLVILILHNGEMRACCLEKNDREPLCRALPKLLAPFRKWRRVHLIGEGGPSHASTATQTFLRSYGAWLRILFTPPQAEWLNQAELLLKSFTVHYLKRGSWRSRQELIDHLYASAPEYNHLFAHPINWTWTRRDLRDWVEWKTSGLS
jgi:DDE superfamily endonuclease